MQSPELHDRIAAGRGLCNTRSTEPIKCFSVDVQLKMPWLKAWTLICLVSGIFPPALQDRLTELARLRLTTTFKISLFPGKKLFHNDYYFWQSFYSKPNSSELSFITEMC
jgi:hypothetical protein